MAYLCVTCVVFKCQYKRFPTQNSTAWVSLMKVKQCLSALLIMTLKDCWSTLLPYCKARAPRAQPNTVHFGLIEPGDKPEPDSQHSAASSCAQYFFPTSGALVDSAASPPCLSASAGWDLGKHGNKFPLRPSYGTKHLQRPENGTYCTSVTGAPFNMRFSLCMAKAWYFISLFKCFKELRD